MAVSRETLIPAYFGAHPEEVDRYAQILATWGIERGLVGPKEGDRIWERHIANCIPLTTLIPEGVSVLDIGSGAGLPGIVIALARPDLRVTLLEPLQRRVDFLIEVVAELGLDITVARGRAGQRDGGVRSRGAVLHHQSHRQLARRPARVVAGRHRVARDGAGLQRGQRRGDELPRRAAEVRGTGAREVADQGKGALPHIRGRVLGE